jgi:hypothetical protein
MHHGRVTVSARRAARASGLSCLLVVTSMASWAAAQARPLETQDPEPIGAGNVLLAAGVAAEQGVVYPLSGLKGNLWEAPAIGINVGLSPIADFQLTGGPYNRLSITDRLAGPFKGLVTAAGDTTHDVEDIVVATKIRLVPETPGRPAVGLRFAVRLPNAKHDSGLGQDTTDFSALLLGGKTIASVRVVVNAGFTIMSEPTDATKQNDVLVYGLSFDRAIDPALEVVGEIYGRWSTRNGVAPIGTESRGEVRLGGRYTRGPVRLDAAVIFGLTSVDPSVGLTAGITYVFKAFALP